jgi:hypothetical protein
MKYARLIPYTFLLLALTTFADSGSLIIGRIENVYLPDVDQVVTARIDTGAQMTSINAKVLEIKKSASGGPSLVSFEIIDNEGGVAKQDRPLLDWVEIKQSSADKTQRRPVVMIKICIAGEVLEEKVNLAERELMDYPVLIGRNFLEKGHFLIDPRKTTLHEPEC